MADSRMTTSRDLGRRVIVLSAVVLLPLVAAVGLLDLRHVNLSIPFIYNGGDDIWQLVLTKMLLDTGWVLKNPFLGAPSVAEWHNNAAAQTSALHSVLMWCIGRIVHNPVLTQQIYYVANFSVISLTSFIACRLLKVSTLLSVCVGLAYAFSTFRFNAAVYSFLANYFVIPLGIVPAIWVVTGRMAPPADPVGVPLNFAARFKAILSRRLLISAAIVVLVAVSDGYYAFFTLLLLCFAGAIRVARGSLRQPLSLVAPAVLVCLLVATVILITTPLRQYQHRHPEEFNPGGVVETTLTKQPFEAEVYSSSIKMMVAPQARHRIRDLRRLGEWMLETSNQARSFKAANWAPLGIMGSLLLFGLFVVLPARALSVGRLSSGYLADDEQERSDNIAASLGLALFATLASISGGIGTLVALAYPTIRAYDRFPLFLLFLLFLAAALLLTAQAHRLTPRARRIGGVFVCLLTALVMLDQTPIDPLQRDPSVKSRFLGEQAFVREMERSLPRDAMVYQFPHSQYLTSNPYYGWGDFRHVRLYLHSEHLRWSNGAAKNSWVDNWHDRMAALAPENLAVEMRAVGFRAFVVDRSVVKDEEYGRLRASLTALLGRAPANGPDIGLVYWTMSDPGYRIEYDPHFQDVDRIIVSQDGDLGPIELPRAIVREKLNTVLATLPKGRPITIERSVHPEVFRLEAELNRGTGAAPIQPMTDMQGGVTCDGTTDHALSVSRDELPLRISNRSSFDWTLNTGPVPIRLGLKELVSPDGMRLRLDWGFRVPGSLRIAAGQSADMRVSLNSVGPVLSLLQRREEVVAVFSMLQEGYAWFGAVPGNTECRVRLVL